MKSATVLVLSAILLVGASETAYCDTFIFSNTCDDGNWFSICAYTGECPPEQQCDTNNWGILGIGSQPAFPGPLDDVILGDFFVTLDSDITLNSLLLPSAAVLRWTDGDLFAGAQVSGPFGINGLLLVDSVNGVRVLMPTQVSGAIHVAGGTLTFSGDLNSGVSASYAIDTDSTLSLAGATVRGAISGNIEGTITNDGNMTIGSQGATFNITGAGFRFGTGTLTINAGGALTNDGIIAGVSNFGFSASALGGDGNLENHGTIDFQLGRWNSASGSTASIVNTNTGVVTKTTGNSAEVNVPFINSGSLNVQLGDLNIGGVFSSDANGVISVDAQGSLSLEGATLSGTFNGSASGDFTNGGNMTIGSQGATFNITGAGFRFGTGTLTINAGGALTNDGIIAGVSNFGFSASALGGDGNLENHGTIDFQLGRWNSASGSTASIVNTNTGVVTKTTGNSAEINVPFINSGIVAIEDGTIAFGAQFTQLQGATALIGGAVSGASTMELQGGLLTGVGSFALAVDNTGGEIAPGSSIGRIIIGGEYVQGAGGELAIDIAGTAPESEYDLLSVTGNAQISGLLAVDIVGGFVPEIGQSFVVLNANQVIGGFDNVVVSGLPEGLRLTIEYFPSSVRISVMESVPMIAGDMNCDGEVDFADLSPFAAALVNPLDYHQAFPLCSIENGDMNQDQSLDGLDLGEFITTILAP